MVKIFIKKCYNIHTRCSMSKYKKGNVVKGVVTGIESYGIFVAFDEYYSGLIHISEISSKFVKNPKDVVNIGDEIEVEIIGVDEEHFHLNLSLKKLEPANIKKRRTIVETESGFKTLALKLPNWVSEQLEVVDK